MALDFDKMIAEAKLTRQSYGLAMAQGRFGGPAGIWLECTSCDNSEVIVGSNSDAWAAVPTKRAAEVFRNAGWTGEGPAIKKARCPKCSAGIAAAA